MIAKRISNHFEGRWLRGYARGKLRGDPVFATAFELLNDSTWPVLDVGCGVGLFPFYLRERGFQSPLAGVDFDATKIAKAQAVSARAYRDVAFSVDDALSASGFRGHVVLFDVLHYLPAARQRPLLERLAGLVAPGAFCLVRATPRDGSWRFRLTQIEELLLRATLWMKSVARHYSSAQEIVAPFQERGFTCEMRPLWGGTPFNSHFFIFRAPESPGALASSAIQHSAEAVCGQEAALG